MILSPACLATALGVNSVVPDDTTLEVVLQGLVGFGAGAGAVVLIAVFSLFNLLQED